MADLILSAIHEAATRREAIELGLDRYFTGVPCSRGHVDYRYLSRTCVSCAREASRKHRIEHPGRDVKYARENKEKVSIKNKIWRAKHPEYTQTSAAWRSTHVEHVAELLRVWRKNNREKLQVYKQNRRAREKSNGGKLSRDIVQKLFILQRGKCACCGASLGNNFHLDHIVPLSLGGSNCDANMQLLTQKCNLRKGAKDPIEFMRRKGLLL